MRRTSPSPPAHVGDGTAADFASGSGDGGVHILRSLDQIILAPSVIGEFDGPELPQGWYTETSKEGGSAQLGDGHLSLDGAGVFADNLVLSDRVVEFSASFARRPNQFAGFGVDYTLVPWVAFGTKFGNSLYARANFYVPEDERLPASLLGDRHRFRVDWRVIDLEFTVDGERAAHLLVPVPGLMRPGAASLSRGAPLIVDWILMTPYASGGRFLSRVFDAGRPVQWSTAGWEAEVPASTEIAIDVRTGPSPAGAEGWSPWAPVAEPGDPFVPGQAGRPANCAQYRAWLRSADSRQTPALRRVTLTYRE